MNVKYNSDQNHNHHLEQEEALQRLQKPKIFQLRKYQSIEIIQLRCLNKSNHKNQQHLQLHCNFRLTGQYNPKLM